MERRFNLHGCGLIYGLSPPSPFLHMGTFAQALPPPPMPAPLFTLHPVEIDAWPPLQQIFVSRLEIQLLYFYQVALQLSQFHPR